MPDRTLSDKRPHSAAAAVSPGAAVGVAPPLKKIIAYKGFASDFSCNPTGKYPFKFEVGQTYVADGKIKACHNGFHACEYPLAVFHYYPPTNDEQNINRFAQVELDADISVVDDKTAARQITIVRELTIRGLTEAAVAYTLAHSNPEEGAIASDYQGAATASGDQGAATASGYQGSATASGDQGAATASGYQGAATAPGYQGAATASGYQGAATASGYQGGAIASGDQGAATAPGYQGAAAASGRQGAATASGYQGVATAAGIRGAATASGDQGTASASGYQGAATASGYQGTATAAGDQGAAAASGYQGAATASGNQGAATASGFYGKVSGKDGCALFLVERVENFGANSHGEIIHVWAGIAGRDGIKPDTFYRLVDGNPVETG